MAAYVELNGLRTWYDDCGEGDPVVLLHPSPADARAFAPNIDALAARFHVFTPERRGHGHTPDAPGPITYDLMAADTIRFLERIVGGPASLIGYSAGAVVALLTALQRSDLVRQLVCVAGVFHRDGWVPEAIDPNNEPPQFLAHSYGEVSPDGAEHFPIVIEKLAGMNAEGPTLAASDLSRAACRTLVMVGDDDEVRLEHTIEFYRALPKGELATIPGTSHGLLVEKPDLCNTIMIDFLTADAVPTIAPIRRRSA